MMLRRLLDEDKINKKQYKMFKDSVREKVKKLGLNTTLYESDKRKEYYTVGEIIRETKYARENDKITYNLFKEILNSIHREDLL